MLQIADSSPAFGGIRMTSLPLPVGVPWLAGFTGRSFPVGSAIGRSASDGEEHQREARGFRTYDSCG